MIKILILNGPNLGALGKREPGLYGVETLGAIMQRTALRGKELNVKISSYQSDIEGELVSRILASRGKVDGIIFNPAAYTHTSLALRDALQATRIPCVEVHLTNTAAREDYRHKSLTATACLGQIMGFGPLGYELALIALTERLRPDSSSALQTEQKKTKHKTPKR